VRKNDFAWFEQLIAAARANNEAHSGNQPEHRAVTGAVAESLQDDALEMAITTYGEESPRWRDAKAILLTERERRKRVRQKRIGWIAFATLIAAAAAVAAPFLVQSGH
jgi:cytochrome c-type biogenesis protein CcmH/NrfG